MAEESGEGKKESSEQKKDSKSKSSGVVKSVILYCAAMVLMTAVAFFLTKLIGQSSVTIPTTASTKHTSKGERPPDNGDDYEGEDGEDSFKGPEYDFGVLIVNPRDTFGTRYLKVTIKAIVASSSVAKEMESRTSQLVDNLISVMSSKSVEEIDSLEGKEMLKKDIKKGLNSILGNGKVKRIYFTEFVFQ